VAGIVVSGVNFNGVALVGAAATRRTAAANAGKVSPKETGDAARLGDPPGGAEAGSPSPDWNAVELAG